MVWAAVNVVFFVTNLIARVDERAVFRFPNEVFGDFPAMYAGGLPLYFWLSVATFTFMPSTYADREAILCEGKAKSCNKPKLCYQLNSAPLESIQAEAFP